MPTSLRLDPVLTRRPRFLRSDGVLSPRLATTMPIFPWEHASAHRRCMSIRIPAPGSQPLATLRISAPPALRRPCSTGLTAPRHQSRHSQPQSALFRAFSYLPHRTPESLVALPPRTSCRPSSLRVAPRPHTRPGPAEPASVDSLRSDAETEGFPYAAS